MPTPGGLPKAGDQLIHEGAVYVITERTSTSAPFSVWVERYDGLPIQGIMTNNHGRLRNRNREYMVPCETGQLPGGWHYFKDHRVNIPPRPSPQARQVRDLAGDLKSSLVVSKRKRIRPIRISPCKRPNPDTGEEVDISLLMNDSQATVMTMSDEELYDLCLRGFTYLRDKREGIL